ncbi:hypothetical protein ABT246_34010 [Streptomyces sp. NPDC001553]|uniref:hypothetical protein n=1 Tax=Streptomyces sp. NPDC001553 TaxID=3154385 RepID=UPI003323EEE3
MTLNPRTELFVIATYAKALAQHPDTPAEKRPALLALADDAEWTGRHCYPGGPWEWSNLKVQMIASDHRRDAVAAGLPPLDTTDPAGLLLDALATTLRGFEFCDTWGVTEVEFRAAPFGRRIEWSPITGVITRFADGTIRDGISYPGMWPYLQDLAALQSPTTGDLLTIRVAPGPSLMPPNPLAGLLAQLFEPVRTTPEQESDDEAPEPAPIPEPAPEPEPAPTAAAAGWTFPEADDHEGWVWHHIDREYVSGTVTRIHFINNGGRSKLTVRVLDGTHKGMAPTLNRSIGAEMLEAAHRMFKSRYGARSKWPVHTVLQRPAAPADTTA